MADFVLLVEDCAEDVEAVQRTLAGLYPAAVLVTITDSDRVLTRLLDPDAERPAMVLLDLNMPGTDGRAVLSRIRAHSELADLPVVVLTSSTDPRDVEECYRVGANSYLFKPVSYALFRAVLRGAFDYWLTKDATA